MKITLTRKKIIREEEIKEKEIELAEGDYVLIKAKGRDTCSFGRFKGILQPKGLNSLTRIAIVDLYHLTFAQIGDLKIPNLTREPDSDYSQRDPRYLEEVISGLDNIIAYLENYQSQEHIGHADLIKRIAEARGK